MATNTHTPDFQDTMPAACRANKARPPRSPAADADDLVTLISPERVVVVIGLLTMVVLLLASIAGVAQSQVARGEQFEYAAPERSTSALAAAYSSRVSRQALERADADAVAALAVR